MYITPLTALPRLPLFLTKNVKKLVSEGDSNDARKSVVSSAYGCANRVSTFPLFLLHPICIRSPIELDRAEGYLPGTWRFVGLRIPARSGLHSRVHRLL